MLDRSLSALVALCLAFLVWLYVRSRDQETLDGVSIPVSIQLPTSQTYQYELEVSGSPQVPVSFAGPPSRIREVRSQLQQGLMQIDVILSVPEERREESRYRESVRIDAADIRTPPGVVAMPVEGRNRIPVVVHRIVERELPVRLATAGDKPVAAVTIEPASVLVRGPQAILDRVKTIPTQLVTIPEEKDATANTDVLRLDDVHLVAELDGRSIAAIPGSVAVRLQVQPRRKVYELPEVPVQFLCPPNFGLRPLFSDDRAGKINLRLEGPAGDDVPVVLAFVDLCGKKWEPGLYEEGLKLQLPKEFQLSQNPPKRIAFQLVPADSPPKPPGIATSP